MRAVELTLVMIKVMKVVTSLAVAVRALELVASFELDKMVRILMMVSQLAVSLSLVM